MRILRHRESEAASWEAFFEQGPFRDVIVEEGNAGSGSDGVGFRYQSGCDMHRLAPGGHTDERLSGWLRSSYL